MDLRVGELEEGGWVAGEDYEGGWGTGVEWVIGGLGGEGV